MARETEVGLGLGAVAAALACLVVMVMPAAAQGPVSAVVDTGFGSGGQTVTNLLDDEIFRDIIALPDGSLVAVGTASGSNAFLVVRHSPDGDYDASFGSGGIVTTAMTGDEVKAHAVTAQPDGRIVVAGTSGDYGATAITLVRYLANGALDTSFGGDGVVTTVVNPDSHNWSADVAVQPDGKIVEVGTVWNSTYDIVVVRYLANGSLDGTFGSGGVVSLDLAGDWDFGYGLALQPDGRIVVAGSTRVAGQYDFALARFLADGSLDETFGSGGTVVTATDGAYSLNAIVVAPEDGALLAAGFNSSNQMVIARYLEDGTLDASFDGDGLATTAAVAANLSATDLELLVDGRIIAVGRSLSSGFDQDLALACFDAAGSLDTSFDTDGVLTVDLAGTYDEGRAVAVQRNGRIIAAGVADGAIDDEATILALVGQSAELLFWDDLESGGTEYWSSAAP